MTVPEQVPVTEQVANGVTVKFFVQFQYANKNDLHIYVDGVEPSISEVYFDDNAFNFYSAPQAGKVIKIQRITPKERDTDYDQSDNTFRPRVVNADFDKIWYVLQEVFADIGGLSQAVQDEVIARIQGDEDLLNQLSAEISARILGDEAVTNDLKDYVNQVVGAILNDPTFNGIDASKVNTGSGEAQQQVNDRGGATWYAKSGGYDLNDRVILDNGDIVRSTVANNTVDPNLDMTGWIKTNSASQIIDKNGKSQQHINDHLYAHLYYITPEIFRSVGDDTAMVQAAIDFCAANGIKEVVFAPKTYLVETLDPKGVTLRGTGQKPYSSYSSYSVQTPPYANSVTILQNPPSKNNLPVFEKSTFHLSDMVIRTHGVPTEDRKLFRVTPSHNEIQNVLFEGLSTLGSDNSKSWGGWRISTCQTMAIQGNVFFGVIVDMTITSNTFTSTNGHVWCPRSGSGLNTLSNNRFEYTTGNHINDYRSRSNAFTGNIFDRSYKHGAYLIECSTHGWSGNVWWRNGYTGTSDSDSHICVQACDAQDFSQDTFTKGKNDLGEIAETPARLVRASGQSNQIKFSKLSLNQSTSDWVISSNSGKFLSVGVIDLTNDADAGGDNDVIVARLQSLNSYIDATITVHINQNRKYNVYGASNCKLINVGNTTVSINASAGSLICVGYSNITVGSVTYTMLNNKQLVSSKPSGSPANGVFPLGFKIQLATPVVGDNEWICFSKGSLDVWKPTVTLT